VLRVLGPIDVAASPLARKLLALLGLHAGKMVSTGEAADVLWNGWPPPTATKSLQNLVVALRRQLGAAAIETAPGGYILTLATDAQEFERLLRAGRPDEALALWRGEPWSDLTDHPRAFAETARLDELRLVAEEDVVERRLGSGAADATLVADAQRLVDDAFLRERRWALLMRALHRSGRSAEALRAAHRLREVLAEEVGTAPGTEIVALELAIARNDPALGVTVDAAGGPAVTALHGAAHRAGEAAAEAGNFAEAVRWLRLAPRRPEVLLQLGRSELAAGEPLAAQATLLAAADAATSKGDAHLALDALVAAAAIADLGTETGERITSELRRALHLKLDDRDRARALAALLNQAAYLATDDELHSWYSEALTAAGRLGDPAVLADVLSSYGAVSAHPSNGAGRLVVAEDLERLAVALGGDAALVRALVLRRWALLEAGDPAHDDVGARLRAVAAGTRDASVATSAKLWSGGGPLLVGDLDAAENEVAEWGLAATAVLPGAEWATAAYISYLFSVRWMQGRLVELVPLLQEASASMPRISTWHSAVAMALAVGGRTDEARAAMAPFFAKPALRVPGNGLWSATMWHLTEAVVVLGDAVAARRLIECIAPVADRHAIYVSCYLGSFHHHLARLHEVVGEPREAAAHAAAAAAAHRRVGARWWVDRP
jgi:DNA-binding SARP family transcriptional activator